MKNIYRLSVNRLGNTINMSVFLVIILALLSGCPSGVVPALDEEYVVFDILISEMFSRGHWGQPPTEVLIISNTTRPPKSLPGSLMSCLGSGIISESTEENFFKVNQNIAILANQLTGSPKYQLVNKDVYNEMMEAGDPWEAFDSRFPDSRRFIFFSRVGFSDDYSEAIVYFDSYCPLCGLGAYAFLVNSENQWELKAMCVTWES